MPCRAAAPISHRSHPVHKTRGETHRMEFGVGSICKVLPVAPSSYYAHLGIRRDPRRASNRARQDVADSAEIRRVHDESRGRYGARKVWHQLRRENKDIARCTVERLMKAMKLQGVVRGKQIITTNPDTSQPCPPSRQICHANRLPGNG